MTDISNIVDTIRTAPLAGYGHADFPTPLDEAVLELVSAYLRSGEEERAQIRSAVSDAHSRPLLAFAERMATQALRSRQRSDVVLGLVALALEGLRLDLRESWVRMALLFDAAERIGINPKDVFAEVAAAFVSPVDNELRAFAVRPQADRSISAMGFALVDTPEGQKYRSTW